MTEKLMELKWQMLAVTLVLVVALVAVLAYVIASNFILSKQALQEMRATQEQLSICELILHTMPGGVARVSCPELIIMQVNEGMMQITGRSSKLLIGQRVSELLEPNARKEWEQERGPLDWESEWVEIRRSPRVREWPIMRPNGDIVLSLHTYRAIKWQGRREFLMFIDPRFKPTGGE